MIMIDNEVVFFALEQCNNGVELLEYIDNLLEAIDADWLLTFACILYPLGWHWEGFMLYS